MADREFINVTVRVPEDMVERADELMPALEQDDTLAVFGRVSRNAVFRLAFAKGLTVLEEEYRKPSKKKRASVAKWQCSQSVKLWKPNEKRSLSKCAAAVVRKQGASGALAGQLQPALVCLSHLRQTI